MKALAKRQAVAAETSIEDRAAFLHRARPAKNAETMEFYRDLARHIVRGAFADLAPQGPSLVDLAKARAFVRDLAAQGRHDSAKDAAKKAQSIKAQRARARGVRRDAIHFLTVRLWEPDNLWGALLQLNKQRITQAAQMVIEGSNKITTDVLNWLLNGAE